MISSPLPLPSPRCAVAGVGSLPFDEPKRAIDFLARWTPEWPVWPQLPRRTSRENMIAQFLGEVPFLEPRNAERTAFTWPSQYEPEILPDCRAKLGPETAAGLMAFLQSSKRFPQVRVWRGLITGPLTLASAIRCENNKSLLASDEHLRALGIYLEQTASVQARFFRASTPVCPSLITLDEPLLMLLGQEGSPLAGRESLVSEILGGLIEAIHAAGARAGVHCCAAADWTAILAMPWDVVSFDAAGYWDSIVAHHTAMDVFLARGGIVAWGAVPTDFTGDPNERAETFVTRMEAVWPNTISQLAEQSLITPACGLGLGTPERAEAVFAACHRVAKRLKTHLS